jgi:hypothetical protein
MNLTELAHKLAREHGYNYSKTYEYLTLQRSDRAKLSNAIMFILEQEN